MKYWHIFFGLVLIFVSCTEEDSPVNIDTTPKNSGVLILCEGLMGQDNSSLTFYDIQKSTVVERYYSKSNAGLKFGDSANDIKLKGDTAYVAVTKSKTIEIFRASTGKWLHRIKFDGKRGPKEMCIVNQDLAFVSDVFDHSVTAFNPSTFKIIKEHIKVGTAPDGLASDGKQLFVANSGYGDLLATKEKASTVSVVDFQSLQEINNIKTGTNPTLAKVFNNKLYVGFLHLPSKTDSLGGIIEYDLSSMKELRRWRDAIIEFTVDSKRNKLFYVTKNHLKSIDLNDAQAKSTLEYSGKDKNENWYSISIQTDNNAIWVGNAMKFQTKGSVYIFKNESDKNPNIHTVGLNPNTILFYNKK